jgi:hypothetical protein
MAATKTARKTGTASRIEKLRALAEHPNTPEHEADLARHALTRLLKKAEVQAEATRYAWAPKWQGAKYQDTRDIYNLTVITKRIRDEIKLLRKLGKQAAAANGSEIKSFDPIGDAPASIKIGVRQPHYGSIKISVTGIPQDWGWRWGRRNAWDGDTCERWLPTDALEALGRELAVLGNAYNYDNSDIMTDYFDRRYYLNVDAAEPDSEWCSHGIGY